MKNRREAIQIAVIAVAVFLAVISGCRNHVAPTDPTLATPQYTTTTTATPVTSPTQTATQGGTPSPGYRIKNLKMYDNATLRVDMDYAYVSGCTPTSASMLIYDETGSLTGTAQAQFDLNGNTVSAVFRDAYNNVYQTISSDTSGGLVTKTSYYDGAGTLTAYILYTYDAQGRITREETYDGTGTLAQTKITNYTPGGQPYYQTVSGSTSLSGATINYTFDGNGNLTRADMYLGTTLIQYEVIQYSATNKVTSVELYSASGSLMASQTQTYDAQDRLLSIVMNGGSMTITYTYDSNGNATSTVMTFDMGGTTDSMSFVQTWEAY